jgi:hypothetical protein
MVAEASVHPRPAGQHRWTSGHSNTHTWSSRFAVKRQDLYIRLVVLVATKFNILLSGWSRRLAVKQADVYIRLVVLVATNFNILRSGWSSRFAVKRQDLYIRLVVLVATKLSILLSGCQPRQMISICQRFGDWLLLHHQGSRLLPMSSCWAAWPLRMEPTGCQQTPVANHLTPRNNRENGWIQFI